MQGHDVFSAYEEARRATDQDLLKLAAAENRVLITNDSDFGKLIYREKRPHRGVVFLRLADERVGSKIAVLDSLLSDYADRLAGSFVVASESVVRFAGS